MRCEIPVNVLKAALLFSADKDVRYYLCGALIDWTAKGTRLVATDGHCAIVCEIDKEQAARPAQAIVHNDTIEAVIKLAGKLHAVECLLENNRLSFTGGLTADPIDGKYPEIDRIIPNNPSGEVAQFDYGYLGDIGKALKILGRKPVAKLEHNGPSSPARIQLTEAAFAVLMPVRV